MHPNEKIEAKRIELQLTDTEVAKKVGLSIDEYFDVELHAKEIFTITRLHQVKKICLVLNLNFFDLFDMRCAFCDEKKEWLKDYLLPRNELIAKRRKELGLTPDELGDKLDFFIEFIYVMERDYDFLEIWRLDDIKILSGILNIPMQILLEVKCPKCDR